jgi:hypothetical protein
MVTFTMKFRIKRASMKAMKQRSARWMTSVLAGVALALRIVAGGATPAFASGGSGNGGGDAAVLIGRLRR